MRLDGSMIAATGIFVVGIVTGFVINAAYPRGLWAWVYDWQTLVVGVFATAAAVATIVVLVWQTREQQREEEAQRQRNLVAEKALLVPALSEVCAHAEAAGDRVGSIYVAIKRGGMKPTVSNLPPLSHATLETFRRVIGCADSADAKYLAVILRDYQLVQLQVNDYVDAYMGGGAIASKALAPATEAVRLHALATLVFRFSRGEAHIGRVRPRTNEAASSVARLGLDRLPVDMQDKIVDMVANS